MATVSITVPNPQVSRINDAFGATYGYQATINGVANPETPSQFTQRMVRDFIKQVTVAYEVRVAAETARAAQATTSEAAITLT